MKQLIKVMITIRKAEEKDASEIVAVHMESWLATYPNDRYGVTGEKIEMFFSNFNERVERWKNRISTYNWVENGIWVAEENRNILGFIAPAVMEGKRRVGAIYVHPRHIGKGVGSMLLKKVFDLYSGQEIFCDVVSYNLSAQKFYEKNGFVFTKKETTLDFQSGEKNLFTIPLMEYVKYN